MAKLLLAGGYRVQHLFYLRKRWLLRKNRLTIDESPRGSKYYLFSVSMNSFSSGHRQKVQPPVLSSWRKKHLSLPKTMTMKTKTTTTSAKATLTSSAYAGARGDHERSSHPSVRYAAGALPYADPPFCMLAPKFGSDHDYVYSLSLHFTRGLSMKRTATK